MPKWQMPKLVYRMPAVGKLSMGDSVPAATILYSELKGASIRHWQQCLRGCVGSVLA